MASRSLIVNFVGDTTQLNSAIKRSTDQLGAFGKAGNALKNIAGFAIATAGIYGIADATKSVAESTVSFQSSMTRIQTQAGASAEQVKKLSSGVLTLAGKVGVAPTTLADGMYHVVSSLNATTAPAQRVSKELAVLKTAAEGARVGGADLVDVTNALDAAVVSGIPGTQNFQKAMGALNATVGAGDMSMQDLADALGTGLLGPMKTFGVSLTDISAALAVFGDNNIRGQTAATKLSSAIRIMAAPSDEASKALYSIGIKGNELGNLIRGKGGLVSAFEDLKQHLQDSGETATEQASTITMAFGGRQSAGVQLLLGQLDRLKAKEVEVGKGADTFGQSVAANSHTMSQQLADVSSQFQAIGIRIGTALLPVVLNSIIPAIQSALTWFSKLFQQFQNGTGLGGQIHDTFDKLGQIIGTVVTDVKGIVNWFDQNKTVAVLLAGAIGGLVVGFEALKVVGIITEAIEGMRDAMIALNITMDASVIGVIVAVAGALVALELKTGFVQKAWQAIKPVFENVANAIKGAANDVVTWVTNAWDNIKSVTSTIWNAVSGFLQKWWPELAGALLGPIGIVVALVITHWTQIKNATMTVWNDIKGVLSDAWNAIKDAFTTVTGFISNHWKLFAVGLVTVLTGPLGGLVVYIATHLTQVEKLFTGAWAAIKTGVVTFATDIASAVVSAVAGAINQVIGFLNDIINVLNKLPFVSIGKIALLSTGGATSGGGSSASAPSASATSAAGFYQGGMVRQPTYMVGEEAPTHPEVVLATNPAYRQRNLGLWSQAGKMLGVPGFATGGIPTGTPTLSYGQLEQLWVSARGPSNVANVAAAIAEAESGGADVMQQGQPFATTGWGYWQITPGGPQFLDPATNAKQAVSDYAGRGFEPWTTYNDGAYKQFLQGSSGGGLLSSIGNAISGAVSGATGLAASILSKGISAVTGLFPSVGKLPPWLQELGKHLLGGAASTAQNKAGGAGASGSFPSGGGFSPSQLGSYDGMRVADWIIPELQWARAHGWGGQVTSGWRSPTEVVHGEFATAPQGQSEHQFDIYPGGAVDVSDYTQFAQVIAGYSGSDKLIQLGIDPLHFSGTGHKTGGIMGYAKGGVLGAGGPLPFPTNDMGSLSQALSAIYAVDGGSSGIGVGPDGDTARLSNLISFDTSHWSDGTLFPTPNFGSIGDPSSFVVLPPTDANGNQPPAYLAQPNLGRVQGELTQAEGWQQSWVGDLNKTVKLSGQLLNPIQAAINRRADEVKKVQARLKADFAAWKKLQAALKKAQVALAKAQADLKAAQAARAAAQKQMNDHQGQIATLQGDQAAAQKAIARDEKVIGNFGGKARPTASEAKAAKAAQADLNQNQNTLVNLGSQIQVQRTAFGNARGEFQFQDSQVNSLQGTINQLQNTKIPGIRKQIPPIGSELSLLGGSSTSIGTGGELGDVMGQLGKPAGGGVLATALGSGSSASGLYALKDTVAGWPVAIDATGGPLDQQKMQLSVFKRELAQLGPQAQAALTAANAAAATTNANNVTNSSVDTTSDTGSTDTSTPDTSTVAAAPDNSALTQALQNQVVQAGLRANSAEALLKASIPLPGFAQGGIPFAGWFGTGGDVVAHQPTLIGVGDGGTEHVSVRRGNQPSGGDVHLHFANGMEWLSNFVTATVETRERGQVRSAIRRLPGQGGGSVIRR